MIETIVRDYLEEKLSVPVYMEVPKSGTSFVVLEKTSGGRTNYVNQSTFAVQSYATSLYDAATLNEEVKSAMDDLIELDDIVRSDINTDYNFTDTTTKKYRYQAVYDIKHY